MTRQTGAPAILVVDDDASVRALLDTLLGIEGYEVRTAPDGLSGLRSFTDQAPDCVVLDVMMPGMDGYEVLRRIRGHASGPRTTVVMLTAADDDQNAWRAWQGGVDFFLGKPFDVQGLVKYLASQLAAVTSGPGRAGRPRRPRTT